VPSRNRIYETKNIQDFVTNKTKNKIFNKKKMTIRKLKLHLDFKTGYLFLNYNKNNKIDYVKNWFWE